jgi:hypothetical protein
MEQKNKAIFEEFETFKDEQEKDLWKIILVANTFFLAGSFILMFVFEGILKLGVVSWYRYWILVAGNLVVHFFLFLALIKNFKVWLLKYILAIYGPLLVMGWIFSTDPNYAKPIFLFTITVTSLFSFLFQDIKVLSLSGLVTLILFGVLFSHYLKIGAPITLYEICLVYLLYTVSLGFNFVNLKRNRFFLTELLQKRIELEDERLSLKIKVEARTRELKELAGSLEEQVKQRTKELQERIDQLQRFQKLTVGRELKMAELKKKIKELEKGESGR